MADMQKNAAVEAVKVAHGGTASWRLVFNLSQNPGRTRADMLTALSLINSVAVKESERASLPATEQSAGEVVSMADLLTKAVGDITAALILAEKPDKIGKWTAPYIHALNDFDATPKPAPDAPSEQEDLLPANPRALAMSIASVEAFMDDDDSHLLTPEVGESIMLVVHELKRLRAIALPVEQGKLIAELVEAAQAVRDGMTSTFRARNGRQVGIEGDDGEKCWIVHSDLITHLEHAITRARKIGGEA